MVYQFRIFSDEIDLFERIIEIDSDALFSDFHQAILDSVKYKNDDVTSFFLCDDRWEKELEITLLEMALNPEEDTWVMDKTRLSELVEDEGQRLQYMFDSINERALYIELEEIRSGHLAKAKCVDASGEAPVQHIEEDFDKTIQAILKGEQTGGGFDLDGNFYGDSEYDQDEFDLQGFNDDFSDDF